MDAFLDLGVFGIIAVVSSVVLFIASAFIIVFETALSNMSREKLLWLLVINGLAALVLVSVTQSIF